MVVTESRATPSSRYERLAVFILALTSFSFVVALNLTPVHTSDFWIQLKVGDVIRASGEIPETLEYTFTEAKDNVFIAFEWLPSLIWSYLYTVDGYNGMIVAKCFLALCVFALIVILTLQRDRGAILALALGAITMLGINYRSLMRPEAIAFVLLLANLNLLHAFVRRVHHHGEISRLIRVVVSGRNFQLGDRDHEIQIDIGNGSHRFIYRRPGDDHTRRKNDDPHVVFGRRHHHGEWN